MPDRGLKWQVTETAIPCIIDSMACQGDSRQAFADEEAIETLRSCPIAPAISGRQAFADEEAIETVSVNQYQQTTNSRQAFADEEAIETG